MKHKIVIEKRAQKFILKQSQIDRERILRAINALPDGDTKLMQGNSALDRLRVGSFRIIYFIEDNEVIIRIVNIGNRGQIYKSY